MMQRESKALRRLWPFAKPDRRLFIIALLATPLAMALSLLQPWLMKTAIDGHIVPGNFEGLHLIAGLFIATIVLRYLIESLYALALAYAGQKTILRLRRHIYTHLVGQAPAFFDKNPAGALLTRATSDVESLGDALTAGVVTILLDVFMVVGVLTVMFSLDWKLTLVLLSTAPVLLMALSFCRKKLRHYFAIIRDSLAHVNAYLAERLGGIELIQLFSNESHTQAEFEKRNKVYRDATIRSNVYDALMYAFVDGMGTVCIAVMLFYASSDVFNATVSAGLLAAFIDYLERLFRPLREFSGKIAIIQRATVAIEKIFGLLDGAEKIAPGRHDFKPTDGRIQIRDLEFSYAVDDSTDVLKGIDLDIAPGEVVAIVGATGSGKTTLSRLLNRSYDGYRGSIQFDEQELSSLHPESIRKQIASVQQDVHLFPDTLLFNVNLGNPEIGQDMVEESAELVHVSPIVESLPTGWAHEVQEGGRNLSAGEGQLVTFARTLAHGPKIIILDEATASVDSMTEALIQNAISRILERKTVIVIAHRLSTIAQSDRIVLLHQGRIAEEGTHEQLLDLGGRYAELVRIGREAGR
ncbi:MAG: ABC transporter ATP-binding protein [Myxococcota bacterium]|nr:ABC transporter ATP-binding protein [Myxococcota bacterium]